jgi:integrator complex subunit 1
LISVDPHELVRSVEDAIERCDDDKLEALLCGAVKHLKANRSKPDPLFVHGLMCLAKERPTCFHSELVIEVFVNVNLK